MAQACGRSGQVFYTQPVRIAQKDMRSWFVEPLPIAQAGGGIGHATSVECSSDEAERDALTGKVEAV